MKTYLIPNNYSSNSALFLLDKANDSVKEVDNVSDHIRRLWVAPEDGVLKISENEEIPVKENDIVIGFYPSSYNKHNVIVINSDKWLENINSEKSYYMAKTNTPDTLEKNLSAQFDDNCNTESVN